MDLLSKQPPNALLAISLINPRGKQAQIMALPQPVHWLVMCKPVDLLYGLPQKELKLEIVPFLRQGSGGGASSFLNGTSFLSVWFWKR